MAVLMASETFLSNYVERAELREIFVLRDCWLKREHLDTILEI
jgi:hypothetical protein